MHAPPDQQGTATPELAQAGPTGSCGVHALGCPALTPLQLWTTGSPGFTCRHWLPHLDLSLLVPTEHFGAYTLGCPALALLLLWKTGTTGHHSSGTNRAQQCMNQVAPRGPHSSCHTHVRAMRHPSRPAPPSQPAAQTLRLPTLTPTCLPNPPSTQSTQRLLTHEATFSRLRESYLI